MRKNTLSNTRAKPQKCVRRRRRQHFRQIREKIILGRWKIPLASERSYKNIGLVQARHCPASVQPLQWRRRRLRYTAEDLVRQAPPSLAPTTKIVQPSSHTPHASSMRFQQRL
eukprot:2297661-Pyramimonas_sp.AAC.1